MIRTTQPEFTGTVYVHDKVGGAQHINDVHAIPRALLPKSVYYGDRKKLEL